MKTRFIIDGREYIDMGTSVLWATCNLGANAPEEFGDYYAFGETKSAYLPTNPTTKITLLQYKTSQASAIKK